MTDLLNGLSADLASILGSETRADLVDSMSSAIVTLGLHAYNLSFDKIHPYNFMDNPDVTTLDESNVDQYIKSGLLEKDPLLKALLHLKRDILWTTDEFSKDEDINTKYYANIIKDQGVFGGVTVRIGPESDLFTAITLISASDSFRSAKAIVPMVKIIGTAALFKAAQLGDAPSAMRSHRNALGRLSGLQTEILSWIAAGKSNAEIAIILDVPAGRVDYHVSHILKTLNVATRVQAATLYSTR